MLWNFQTVGILFISMTHPSKQQCIQSRILFIFMHVHKLKRARGMLPPAPRIRTFHCKGDETQNNFFDLSKLSVLSPICMQVRTKNGTGIRCLKSQYLVVLGSPFLPFKKLRITLENTLKCYACERKIYSGKMCLCPLTHSIIYKDCLCFLNKCC